MDTVRFSVDSDDYCNEASAGDLEYKRMILLEMQMCANYSFWLRVWEAMKYIAGREVIKSGHVISRYHHKEFLEYLDMLLMKKVDCSKGVEQYTDNKYVLCENDEHIVKIFFDDEIEGFHMTEIVAYLNYKLSLYKRFKLAFKHVFYRYDSRYGTWDDFDLDAVSLKKMYDLIAKVKFTC